MATIVNGKMLTTLSKEVLEKYPNEIFVETGTAGGHGTQIAIECGFKKIYTIENDHNIVLRAQERFKNEIESGVVEIIEGDSFKVFSDILDKIDKPATFWLDAHWEGSNLVGQFGCVKGEYKCPLPFELELFLSHKIKDHTILVDDRRMIGNSNSIWGDNLDLNLILEAIMDINPNYNISYEDGFVPDDIIAAHLK
tara:strand:+ start:288 stop:875 length:588 start_codon:yes stop_codon:yes gene_type:complete